MVTEELLQFVRAQRATGMKEDEIGRLLIAEGGWNQGDVDEVFRALGFTPPPSPIPSLTPTPPQSETKVGEISSVISPSQSSSGIPSTSSPAENKEAWSLDGVLAKAHSPVAPLQAAASIETPTPLHVPASIPAQSSPMKFDLSTLRSAIEPTSAPPVPVVSPPPQPMLVPVPVPAIETVHEEVITNTKKEAESVASILEQSAPPSTPSIETLSQRVPPPSANVNVPSVASEVPLAAEEPKKVEISAKRTMASDLLLRGMGAAVPNMPAISVPPEPTLPETEKKAEEVVAEAPVDASVSAILAEPPPFQDEGHHRSIWRRVVEIILGLVLILVLLSGASYAYLKFQTPNPQSSLGSSFSQFFDVSTFAYRGRATTDLAISAVDGALPWFGAIKFSLGYEGMLGNGSGGYDDGLHRISFTGGWQTGSSTLATSLDVDARIIKDTLYFRILSFPEKGGPDLLLFKENWVKVNFSDLFNELQLSGVLTGQGTYGSFGATAGGNTFNALLGKAIPLTATGDPVDETVDGVATSRTHVSADPALMADFARALYRKYFNQNLTLSSDQLVRLKNALAKISGDIWVDPQTGALLQIVLSANFDDDMAGIHVKGPLSVRFVLGDYNKPASVDVPPGALTLAEIRSRTADYLKTKEMRARDQVKSDYVKLVAQALENYRQTQGRYPKELSDISAMNALATSSLTMKDYFYRSYQKAYVDTTSAQCKTTGKECAFYHLGINLEDASNTVLKTDADLTTALLGADTAGCGSETGLACYDLVSPVMLSNSTSHSAPLGATTTPAH